MKHLTLPKLTPRKQSARSALALTSHLTQRPSRLCRQVEETRQRLGRLRQLMTSVEEAHASGQRLSEAVPHQLTELLASVGQLSGQPPSADDSGDGTDRAQDDGQRSVGTDTDHGVTEQAGRT